jgi:hypothetical protein
MRGLLALRATARPLVCAGVLVASFASLSAACSAKHDASSSSLAGNSNGGDAGHAAFDAGMGGGNASFPPTGNAYVDARRCPACHESPNPATDGVMAGAPAPLPGFASNIKLYGPNLTPDNDTGIGAWTDDQLANAIRNGIDDQGERLCPQMQHFADMPDAEMQSIISFLRALPAVHNVVTRSTCPPLKP